MSKNIKIVTLALFLLFAFMLPAYAHIASADRWGANFVAYDSGYIGNDATNRIKESANDWNSKVTNFQFRFISGASHKHKPGSTSSGAAATTYLTIGNDYSTNIVGATTNYSTSVSWYYGTGSPSSNQFDFLSVCKHEFGHWYHLFDCYNSSHSSSVMYGYISSGQVKRTIQSHDSSPAQSMY